MPHLEELIEEMTYEYNRREAEFKALTNDTVNKNTRDAINRRLSANTGYVSYARGGETSHEALHKAARKSIQELTGTFEEEKRTLDKLQLPGFLAYVMKNEKKITDETDSIQREEEITENVEANEKLMKQLQSGSAAERKQVFYKLAEELASIDFSALIQEDDKELAEHTDSVVRGAMIGMHGRDILDYFDHQGLELTDADRKNFMEVTDALKANSGRLMERLERACDPFYGFVNYSRTAEKSEQMAASLEDAANALKPAEEGDEEADPVSTEQMKMLAERIRQKGNEIDSVYVENARKLLGADENADIHFGVMKDSDEEPTELSGAEAQKMLEDGGIVTAYTKDGRKITLIPLKLVGKNGELAEMQQVRKPGRFVRGLDAVLRTIGFKNGIKSCRTWEAAQLENTFTEETERKKAEQKAKAEKVVAVEHRNYFKEKNQIFAENALKPQELVHMKKAAEAAKDILDENIGFPAKNSQNTEEALQQKEQSLFKLAEKLTAAQNAGPAFETSLGELLKKQNDEVKNQRNNMNDLGKYGDLPTDQKAKVFGAYLKQMNEMVKKMDLLNMTAENSALIRHCDDVLNVFRRNPNMIQLSNINNQEVMQLQAAAAFEKIWRDSQSAEASLIREGLGEVKLTKEQHDAALQKAAAYRVVRKSEIDDLQNYRNNHPNDKEGKNRKMSETMKMLAKAVGPADAVKQLNAAMAGRKAEYGTLAAMNPAELMTELGKADTDSRAFAALKGGVNHDIQLENVRKATDSAIRKMRKDVFKKDMTTVARTKEMDRKIKETQKKWADEKSKKKDEKKEPESPVKKNPELSNLYMSTLTR